MALAVILVMVGIVLLAVGAAISIMAYDGAEILGGFLLSVVGFLVLMGGASLGDSLDHSSDESGKICAEKHGLVNDDGYCIVKGAPVEYSPGVWKK